MRWHSAYESQRRSPPAETLSLLPSFQSPREDDLRATSTRRADLRRARALLKSAGFVYLLAAMRPATSSPSTFVDRRMGTTDRDQPFQPTLTLFPIRPSEPSSRPCSNTDNSNATESRLAASNRIVPPTARLATLRTQCPPCPGCRSAVDLHFCPSPQSSAHSRTSAYSKSPARSSSWVSIVKFAMADFVKEGSSLVTGRTIAVALSAQLSFLFTMYSMAHARDHTDAPSRRPT